MLHVLVLLQPLIRIMDVIPRILKRQSLIDAFGREDNVPSIGTTRSVHGLAVGKMVITSSSKSSRKVGSIITLRQSGLRILVPVIRAVGSITTVLDSTFIRE